MTASFLILGGSGFVGRHLANRLVAAGHRIVVPTRRRERAKHLILLPTADVVQTDIRDRESLARLVRRVDAVINLVGILNETRRGDFERVHVELTKSVIAVCRDEGVPRLLHMSALNADPQGPSEYLRSKGRADDAVAQSGLAWTIFRPSVLFGPEDSFLNTFAKLAARLPFIALAAPDAEFQPVYVRDVAFAMAAAIGDDATLGSAYSLCGPKRYRLRDLVAYAASLSGHPRPIVPLGPALSKTTAAMLEHLPGKLMSRDNLASMRKPNVCDCPFPAFANVVPSALEAIAPHYLSPASLKGPYDALRTQSGR